MYVCKLRKRPVLEGKCRVRESPCDLWSFYDRGSTIAFHQKYIPRPLMPIEQQKNEEQNMIRKQRSSTAASQSYSSSARFLCLVVIIAETRSASVKVRNRKRRRN
ncbi:hypothetical protein L596_001758 [Steinernema carpocapsae]|uniref:Uncharacterized protein n=1 Tax=Steinernema carpocapsae TaxID=34508 RepID=A0A4U8UR22_STECR|nr:hypothetical protein L596_001758 [Steinernema carpocapsae]